MKTERSKELKKYLELPYTIILKRDEDGDAVASVKELRGCVAHGATPQEALEQLESMKILWLESRLEEGATVPLPEEESDLPSGKWLQRVPRSLHAKIAKIAEEDGVSLNQWVSVVLANEVGIREGKSSLETVQASWSDSYAVFSHMNWHMDPAATPEAPFVIEQLVQGIPYRATLNQDTELYGKKGEHKNWKIQSIPGEC